MSVNCIILRTLSILWISILTQINLLPTIYHPVLIFLKSDFPVLSMNQYSETIIIIVSLHFIYILLFIMNLYYLWPSNTL